MLGNLFLQAATGLTPLPPSWLSSNLNRFGPVPFSANNAPPPMPRPCFLFRAFAFFYDYYVTRLSLSVLAPHPNRKSTPRILLSCSLMFPKALKHCVVYSERATSSFGTKSITFKSSISLLLRTWVAFSIFQQPPFSAHLAPGARSALRTRFQSLARASAAQTLRGTVQRHAAPGAGTD